MLPILERRCICREDLAAPGPSDISRVCKDAEEDVDSTESRRAGKICPVGDLMDPGGDSEVRSCSWLIYMLRREELNGARSRQAQKMKRKIVCVCLIRNSERK